MKKYYAGGVLITLAMAINLFMVNPVFAETDVVVNGWDQQARDKIYDVYYRFYVDAGPLHNNPIESELFVLYRLAQNNYFDLIATDFWRAEGRDYRDPHTESSGWLGLESYGTEVNRRPKAKSVAVDPNGQIYWVISVGVNGEQIEVEWVDLLSADYQHETKHVSQFEGFIHFLDEYDYNINYQNGYIPYKKPIFNGYPDGSLRPFGQITRAEFVQTLANMLELDVPEQTVDVFSDINGNWARNTINTFSKLNIVSGYPDGSFRPNNQITMAEALAVVTRIWDYIGYDYLGADDVDIIEHHFNKQVKGIQELLGYGWDWLRQIKTPEDSFYSISRDNWAYPYIAATYPIIDARLFFEDYESHKDDNHEISGKLDWSRPIKRYQVAALLNILTNRRYFFVPENERQFTDIKNDYYKFFDNEGEETDYPEIIMLTSAFDFQAEGLVNKNQYFGNILALRDFKAWEQQRKSHQD